MTEFSHPPGPLWGPDDDCCTRRWKSFLVLLQPMCQQVALKKYTFFLHSGAVQITFATMGRWTLICLTPPPKRMGKRHVWDRSFLCQGTCSDNNDCALPGYHICMPNCLERWPFGTKLTEWYKGNHMHRTWYPLAEHPNNTQEMVNFNGIWQ